MLQLSPTQTYAKPPEKVAIYSDGTLEPGNVNKQFSNCKWSLDLQCKVVVWDSEEKGALEIQEMNPKHISIHHGKEDLKGKHFIHLDRVILDDTKFRATLSTPQGLEQIFNSSDALRKKKCKLFYNSTP
jgi:hypothetical protein